MCFGEHISRLINGCNRIEVKSSMQEVMEHKMAVDLYVFGVLMEDIIMSNLNCTSIAT
jgi:hypothetical protein